jgi:hypothetical protein
MVLPWRLSGGALSEGGRPLVAVDISLQRWRVRAMLAIGSVGQTLPICHAAVRSRYTSNTGHVFELITECCLAMGGAERLA